MALILSAVPNFGKVGTGVENDKNVDSYPVTPILPLVVVLANPVNVTVFSSVTQWSACVLLWLTFGFGLARKQRGGLVRLLFILSYVNKYNNNKYIWRAI